MNKFLRILAILLAIVLTVSLASVVAFADDTTDGTGDSSGETGGETGSGDTAEPGPDKIELDADLSAVIERLAVINSQGYNFPAEGDLTIPKYKIVAPDGTETVRYSAGQMSSDAKNSPDGATIVLLSDIYQSNTFVKAAAANNVKYFVQVDILGSKTLNFDFAGHTIFSEYKQTFFTASEGATLNIYSSVPGAKLMCLEEGKSSGGAVLTVSQGSKANFGDYGDYPGSNISTYSAGGIISGSNVEINVSGVSMYRVATDYVSFFGISGHDSTVNYVGARFFGVGRYLQIACREDGDGKANTVYRNVVTFDDCVISNIGSAQVLTGIFFRYMADDNEIHFKSTVLDYVNMECQKYYSHIDATDAYNEPLPGETMKITFDKYCSYNHLPDVISIRNKAPSSKVYAMYHFPELDPGFGVTGSGTPPYILANGLVTDVDTFVINDDDGATTGYYDYRIFDLTDVGEDISGMYVFPFLGYEEEIREVTWNFRGSSSNETELWIKGEQPVPYRLNIPKDNKYVKYVIDCFYEDELMAYYSVDPTVDITLKCNFRFADQVYINVYIPEFEGMVMSDIVYRMTVAGTTMRVSAIEESGVVTTIDGVNYTQVTVQIPYDRISDEVHISVDIANASGLGSAFSATAKVELDSMLESYLDSDECDDEFKAEIADVLYVIYKKGAPGKIMGISSIVTERFADRIAAENQTANSSESFIDKILNMFKK